MSDEEKKAIDYLKNCLDNEYNFKNATRQKDKKAYNIILNLIEKQAKEIEELKKNPIFLIKDLYNPKLKKISLQDVEGLIEQGREQMKDKIKAKIEEIDREIEFEQNERVIIYLHKQKRVLQSLLEKE